MDDLYEGLRAHLDLPTDAVTLEGNADALDAVVCFLRQTTSLRIERFGFPSKS